MSLLSVRNLGKAYRSYRSEWLRFGRWFGLPFKPSEEVWVLRRISFDLQPGEAVGIVGQNGAGKSTLLKLITGTLQPTEGTLEINGRISALLELGLSFNPELTGRQNCQHAAGLMGFSPHQIHQAMPDIEDFAEIGGYFDEPIRTYSSGMQARVAFAVATAFRPDILIVDEVLAVGDAYFIHKSANRIREFQQQGTSLLVVAHDRSAIQTLCDRAILLDKGRVIREGRPEEVMDYYNALIAEKENATVEVRQLQDGRLQTISGSGEARLETIALLNEQGEAIEYVGVGQSVALKVVLRLQTDLPDLVFGYMIKDRHGQPVFGTNTFHWKIPLTNLKGGTIVTLDIAFTANIGPGSYSITTALHTGDTHVAHNYEWRDLALVFTVDNLHHRTFVGVNWLPPRIAVSR
jgi:lipopolysaccharide transport system ATP-binding protein